MQRLLKYDRIGLDFDGTLVDGPTSPLLQDFVRSHPEKKYYIITHRTHTEAIGMDHELEAVGLYTDQFEQILPILNRMKELFDLDQAERRMARLPPIEQCDLMDMGKAERQFILWKGYACRQLGVNVLVDDIPKLSQPGCTKYRVDLINSRTLRPLDISESYHRFRNRWI
jgi:hypothetical protein